ncbi:MAG: YybH family protein [Pyrinomonadaceae bacterium]
MRLLVLAAVLILTALNAAAQTQRQSPGPAVASQSVAKSGKKQIEKRLSLVCGLWAKYWKQKQLDDVIALYAPEAVFLTGTGDRISGRSAIRTLFKTAMEGHTSDLTPRSLVTEVSGNLAYDSGDYLETIVPASGVATTELKGNYVIVFKRQQNGKWLIIEHVWTDKPAQ